MMSAQIRPDTQLTQSNVERMHGRARVIALIVCTSTVGLSNAARAQPACLPTHTISAIQGNELTPLAGRHHNDVSPLNGQTVTIEGVVVGDFQSTPQPTRSGELRGMRMRSDDAASASYRYQDPGRRVLSQRQS